MCGKTLGELSRQMARNADSAPNNEPNELLFVEPESREGYQARQTQIDRKADQLDIRRYY